MSDGQPASTRSRARLGPFRPNAQAAATPAKPPGGDPGPHRGGAVPDEPPLPRRLFGNRTLNLRRIRAIGYDMDYTLVHYRVDEWERRAYEHTLPYLARRGWPTHRRQ